jgi:hypothetical protein
MYYSFSLKIVALVGGVVAVLVPVKEPEVFAVFDHMEVFNKVLFDVDSIFVATCCWTFFQTK